MLHGSMNDNRSISYINASYCECTVFSSLREEKYMLYIYNNSPVGPMVFGKFFLPELLLAFH